MNQLNKTTCCIIFLFIIFTSVNYTTSTYASSIKKEAPQNVIVKKLNNKSLRIKWKKTGNVDGYRIYKYIKAKKKYVSVKTVYGAGKTHWTDKNLKPNKIYKYKVSSFKLKKKRKVFSKRSDRVSARTYGKDSKLVNAEFIDVFDEVPVSIGLCDKIKLQPMILPDSKSKSKKKKVFSKKVRWFCYDNSLININKNGVLTSFDKAGDSYIYIKAHNGLTRKIKINVINYAAPTAFPGYEGNNVYINDLLMNYRTEVFNIATYFTIYGKPDISGVIKSDGNNNIIGIPQLQNISTISDDIKKLITNFPLVINIYYSEQGVRFKMNYAASGKSFCEVSYSKHDTYEDSPLKIAPHWIARQSVKL